MKNKIISLILVGILFLSGFGIIATAEENRSESIVITEPIIGEYEGYSTVGLVESTSYLSEVGKPMIPIIAKVFTLPFGSKICSVDISFSEAKEIQLSKEIKPVPESVLLIATSTYNSKEIVKDMSVYGNSDLYPSASYSYTVGSGLDGNEHVTYVVVHCYPVRYNPSENIIYYSENAEINIAYESPSTSKLSNDEYDMVILSPSKFSNTLQTLIDHKNSHGVDTFLKPVEEIYTDYQGRDKPEQIKYFVKDALESYGIKYVLLIGDMDLMPIRITAAARWDEGGLPTDLYYADIYDENGTFCDWDYDNDNIFGEYDHREGNIDNVDLFADVKVGRLPARNKLDLKTIIGKIITYETQTYGSDWFDRAVLMGGDTFPGDGPYEGEVATEEVSQQIPEFECTKLWTSTGNYGPFRINREITKGAGFVSYSGHGYEFGFGTSAPNEEDRIEYYTPYTVGMLNANKFPVIFFDACLTAKLDYNFSGVKLPCLAWYLLKKPVGGMIAAIGATRVAFTHVDESGVHGGAGYMNVHFFKAYEPGVIVSDMLTSAQNDYLIERGEWKDCFTLEEFILVGDPSLKVGGYPTSNEFNVEISESELNGYQNTPIEFTASANAGKQPYSFNWDLDEDEIFDDAIGEIVEWTWANSGVYWISVKATDNNGKEKTYKTTVNIETKTEKPTGPSSGKPNLEYTFTAKTSSVGSWTEVYYYFDWNDGTYSDILGPYSPNANVQATHVWKNAGSYSVKVKTLLTNSQGDYEETGWSDPIVVSIAKNKFSRNSIFTQLLERIFQHFPKLSNIF